MIFFSCLLPVQLFTMPYAGRKRKDTQGGMSMKKILILGAGTGGTIVANKLSQLLDLNQWQITVLDKDANHYYQPGFLFLPFGIYQTKDLVKTGKTLLDRRINYRLAGIVSIDAEKQIVELQDGASLGYDYLVIATGTNIAPEETEGMLDAGWRENIFDFYTFDGALALSKTLQNWEGGRLVVNVAEMPIKCPVAPLEFLFLADWYFAQKGMREKVELVYATPLSGAFTKPQAKAVLGDMLQRKGICVEADFNIGEVDGSSQLIRSYDNREIGYDLLVTIPTNKGAELIGESGLGDDLNYVPTDPYTLQSKHYESIFVIGDASNVPTSKAGSVVHFMHDTLVTNLLNHIEGKPLEASFDGHANCFIESGYGKAYLIDFNYVTEPLRGSYPLPNVGPFSLLDESRINHLGKLAFRYLYWNVLLKALPLPIGNQMSMAGKVPA
jgi:sulfide:quinone oxidoreductase